MIMTDRDMEDISLNKMLESWGYTTYYFSLKSSDNYYKSIIEPDLIIIDFQDNSETIEVFDVLKKFDVPIINLNPENDITVESVNPSPYMHLDKPFNDEKLKFAADMVVYHSKTDKKLKENEENYRLLYENAPIAYQSLDEDGYFLEVNNTWLEKLGYIKDNVIDHWFGDFLAPEYVEVFKKNFPIFKSDGEIYGAEFDMLRADGSRITVSYDGKIGYDEIGNFKQTHCIFKDITDQKRAEKALKDSEQYYKTIFENTGTATIIVEEDSTISLVNTEFEELYGQKKEYVEGKKKWYEFVSEEHLPMMKNYHLTRRISSEDVPRNYEFDFYDFNGNKKNIFTTIAIIPGTGKSLVSLQDITFSKNAEKQLKINIKEKDTLLREIHHRVKNNLQIISSLLNLQSRYIEDSDALDVFTESQNRVRSMAIIHEKLYNSNKMSKINFGEYITDLTDSLFYSFKVDPSKILLTKTIDNVFFDVDTSIPCGLIINELITNCIKHAFPGDNKGEINIELLKNDIEYTLKVSDNGTGFPDDLDFRNTESLGLQLVISLVNQLDGTIMLDVSNGTSFTIKFKELLYSNRK